MDFKIFGKRKPEIELKGDVADLDLEYMNSLSAATLQKSSKSYQYTLWALFSVTTFFIVWSNYTMLDEITRGSGKIIPSQQIQSIQSLEGGIVAEILIKEGDTVKKEQPLAKLHDLSFASDYDEKILKLYELSAKAARLRAESTDKEIVIDELVLKNAPNLMRQEISLYNTNKEQLSSKVMGMEEQIAQRKGELNEQMSKKERLEESYRLVKQELDMTEPLVKKGIVSEVEFLKIKRDVNNVYGELRGVELSIPRIKSTITETQKNLEGARLEFKNRAKKELNEVFSQIEIIKKQTENLEDKVKRTLLTSPVEGIVKRVLVNTIGGVIKPGDSIIELVPIEDKLVAEIKIKPQDIAFLHPNQDAVVKFTAYDFAIYGGLKGNVYQIGADTITDNKGDSYYLVKVSTEKNYLEHHGKKLDIIVGMTVDVNIVTGKKSLLDYILKPILKTKQNSFTER